MASITAVEVGLIAEFRKRFQSGELNEDQSRDLFLVRWIRARNHNLDKAEEMLRKSLKWRKENDIDNISSWEPPKEIEAMVPIDILGTDADNIPYIVLNMGKVNLLQIVKTGQQATAIKYIQKTYEVVERQITGEKKQRDGTPVTAGVAIFSYKGFSFKTCANVGVAELFLNISKSFEANRPEILNKMYVINAGKAFTVLFSLVKPILATATRNKISVYNSASKWKPVLQKNIPADILPVAFGGSNSAFEFKGGVQFDDGGDDVEEGDELLPVSLASAGKTTLVVEVSEKNSTINWAFQTDKKGISFTITSNDKTNVENTKVDSHLKLSEGSITCDAPGDYVFIFDNTANSEVQELQYRFDVRSTSGAKQLAFD